MRSYPPVKHDVPTYEAKQQGRNQSFAASALKHAFVESGPLQFSLES
jgi:hypothetical protein